MPSAVNIKCMSKSRTAITIVPDIEKLRKEIKFIPGSLIRDYKKYCMFCAKQFWYFNDHMEQVVCDPIKSDFIEAFDFTIIDRCWSCKQRKRKKAFDGRIITDPKKLTLAESDFERPRLWKNSKTRK